MYISNLKVRIVVFVRERKRDRFKKSIEKAAQESNKGFVMFKHVVMKLYICCFFNSCEFCF